MNREYMDRFLVKSVIIEVRENDMVYNCVWRAHRDVLTGRFHLKEYLKKSREITDCLSEFIKNQNTAISSEMLINKLEKEFNVEFGAIQKLVNMTLKYLIILNEYTGFKMSIDLKKCDCPLDGTILKKAGRPDLKWTSISRNEYNEVQNYISEQVFDGKGNIEFDFRNW